jgi:arylsulfatase A
MKNVIIATIAFLSLFLFINSIPKTKTSPNVLLILTDDQGYGDLGIHGNDVIETPVIDKLAKESAQIERFYVSPL